MLRRHPWIKVLLSMLVQLEPKIVKAMMMNAEVMDVVVKAMKAEMTPIEIFFHY